ncbi:hypothetical protein ACEWY4_018476 [Coilia grayii]|uniref:Uncharacterized protein n=1 Tax=Coilia grayii TaxID=363190 RepID=A0ABD1JEJ9_9TELE
MHTFAAPKLLTLPASLGNRDHISSYCLPLHCVSSYGALAHNYYGNLRLSEEKLPGPKPDLLEPKKKCSVHISEYPIEKVTSTPSPRDGSPKARYPSDSNVRDKNGCGRHFLFDTRWKNGRMEELKDDVYLKTTSIITPLPRSYHVQRSNNLYRFSLCRQPSNKPANSFCPFEGYNLTSVPSRLLPATSIVAEKSLSMEPLKHRPRMSNRACSLFTIGANQKSQSYPDPVAGAASSFIQRLTEISSLEGETIRQEKVKRIKKSRKQD